MKIFQTEINPGNSSLISIVERDLPAFTAPFHCHTELELVYILEGYGKRIIGDHIAPFAPGDLVFLGANLPHRWMSEEPVTRPGHPWRAKAIVVYFNKDLFGPAFYNTPESGKLKELFQKANRGICITGPTRDVLTRQLEQLLQKKDFERVLGLLTMLHELSGAEDIQLLSSENFSLPLPDAGTDRLADVRKYVQEHYSKDISLNKVAAMASLTRPSFCRLFRQRSNKHFIEYLNEVRIGHACQFLLDTDLGIAEIAHQCGYKTVSNFNKQFKKITGENPKAYRAKLVP